MISGRYITRSPEETEALGAEVAGTLKSGDRVGLIGELGSGKTRFVRGIANGLGSKGFVKSPSFTIINIYPGGRLPLYHIDLYRICKEGEFYETGLEEFVYGKGISVIEWADRLSGLKDGCTVLVSLSYKGENEREIVIERAGN
ncbi:MAG: tRNA (adenosine(37)-N6)-threonylcarbamoyltransferase complex ATPase subunit type 1 TsaE [Deltaproteobacteria bacterium]|nr:tRNA (adenosine(37)-N6)-threonylcarbamoyltransferase complex ATPase subunit type 1 TsaE [Deltaproteobacteria bacterium]